METKELCIYCMSGVLREGICTGCGKPASEENRRPPQTLPARHMLGGGQYYLGRVLGSGGFGITYLAWDRASNRKVAVKELFPKHLAVREEHGIKIVVQPGLNGEFQHSKLRFQQEAQALYELRSVQEIINVHRLFEENGTAYYVMEFLEGQDLKGYLSQNGVMRWEQIQPSVRMILKALQAIHEKQLIHRDISPDNIFMLRGGGVKLIDFGNARSYMSANPMTKILKTRFAPPEQFGDEDRQGPWTDIYALSVTLYYAMSGILPAASTERVIAVNMQGNDLVKPLYQVKADIPKYVSQAIEKGMAVKVQDRFHTIAEFAGQLFPGVWDARPVQPMRQKTGPRGTSMQPRQQMGSQGVNMQSRQQTGTQGVNMQSRQQTGTQGASMQSRQQTGTQEASAQSRQRTGPQGGATFPMLKCVQGRMQGKQLLLRPGAEERLGRGSDVSIAYPADCPGISRHQCTFMLDNRKRVYVRDDNSSYGTMLNGKRMKPLEWYLAERGSSIRFAKEEYIIV